MSRTATIPVISANGANTTIGLSKPRYPAAIAHPERPTGRSIRMPASGGGGADDGGRGIAYDNGCGGSGGGRSARAGGSAVDVSGGGGASHSPPIVWAGAHADIPTCQTKSSGRSRPVRSN